MGPSKPIVMSKNVDLPDPVFPVIPIKFPAVISKSSTFKTTLSVLGYLYLIFLNLIFSFKSNFFTHD